MNVFNMVEDYRQMCGAKKEMGNFAAYKAYTEKYPDFFGGVFKYLYMTDIDNL